jgi:type I restriction enzyme S subunit
VPEHWGVVPLKYLVAIRSGGTPSKERLDWWSGDVPWASAKDLKSETLANTADHITAAAIDAGAAATFPAGLVLVLVRGMMLARAFPVVVTLVPMAINQDLKALDGGDKVLNRYLAWSLRGTSQESLRRIDEAGHGTKALRMGEWTSLPLPMPPVREQEAVSSFLDRETAKIDALVAEQKRLIELLEEKRQAVISHAVTKGLDPDVPMKDSGVEWLGEVPAHWMVAPTGSRYEVQLGRMLNEERAQGDNLRPYLRVFDVQWGRINTEGLPLMDFPPDAQKRYRLLPGDLIVNEGGSYVGRSAIWKGELPECYYQKALHRLRRRDASLDTADFLIFAMEVATRCGAFIAGGNQTTIDHLTADQLRRHRFAFPPLEEQCAIAQSLNRETINIEALVSDAENAITLLQERRSALISAAVSGKIDVRGLTAARTEAA